MPHYLYRGENSHLYQANEGNLVPKAKENPFCQHIYFGGDSYFGDGSTFGKSSANAVIQHQRDSSKNPTSGVSTTPHLENAKRYATQKGEHKVGYVFCIDTALLADYGVSMHSVAAYATAPSIPGDEEVILVARDFGTLPSGIIVEVFEVLA
jgi:hypothetical protein